MRSGTDRVLAAIAQSASAPEVAAGDESGLPVLEQAFKQLFEVMARIEGDALTQDGTRPPHPTGIGDITELGEYALRLHENLTRLAGQADLEDRQSALAGIAVDFALWVARHGGQIDTLEPVVDALALFANNTSDPQQLEGLSAVIARITTAVSPLVREDLEKINPGRPWRVLLLNHGIVATRSHNPALMEDAFALLTRHLPEDAARFFTEGMQQMDALDYPPQVREVMEKYHRRWTLSRALH